MSPATLNAGFRKEVRHRGHFPNEQAAMNVLYLVSTTRRHDRQNMTDQIKGWKHVISTLTVHYANRVSQ